MVDITRNPYFSFDDATEPLMKQIKSQANIDFLSFRRCFHNHQHALIIATKHKQAVIDFFDKEYYRLSSFNKDISHYESSFHMWDHIMHSPTRYVLHYMREQHSLAHGLMIIQQHGTHCDFFVFAADSNNTSVNNFYLDKKELFLEFINNFYRELDVIIKNVSHCGILIPPVDLKFKKLTDFFSPRQQECGKLLVKGWSAKEIARELKLSPRTVEDYINILRKKSGAKNRTQLVFFLSEYLEQDLEN